MIEQRIRKKNLAKKIGELADELKVNKSINDLNGIDKTIQAIRDKIGLKEDEILNLVEQRLKRQEIESEIDEFAKELQ